MAGRKPGFRHTEKTRNKIRATQLVNRLQKCVMGEVELSAQQVNAAKTLLNKVLPDLSNVEVQATVNDVTEPRELSDAELARIATGSSGGATDTAGSKDKSPSVH